jgi:hypothetical protein
MLQEGGSALDDCVMDEHEDFFHLPGALAKKTL